MKQYIHHTIHVCIPLSDDAKEFLAAFSKEYLKMYAKAMLERIQAEVEGSAPDPRRLRYREVNYKTRSARLYTCLVLHAHVVIT